jgi:hypothetical protein
MGLAAGWPFLPRLAAEELKVPAAGQPAGALPLEAMVGEQLDFNIAFWLFSRAGYAQLSLRPLAGPPENLYEASMSGQTAGVIGFFTRYRKDTYRSAMEFTGERLRPLEFQEEVIIGNEVRRRRTTLFDYAAGVILRRKVLRGGGVEAEELPMEPGVVYDDYLSGLYNLRSGAYGPLRPGRSFVLNVPRKKGGTIRIELAGPAETLKLLEREKSRQDKAFFCRIFMHKDTLGSGTGRLEGWWSAQAVPLSGVVEDVALFGDVKGTLVNREAPSGQV